MTILGHDWLFSFRRKHSVGRQITPSYRSMTIPGQDWVCLFRRKHSVGRQSALSKRGMTILGQKWSCCEIANKKQTKKCSFSWRTNNFMQQFYKTL
jgi:hypothetical protein